MLISNKPHLLATHAYLNTCGITGDNRKQITDFANGLESLGIWNNVVFWMLRSGQMRANDATAYCLGGLAPTAHGTIGGNPTRSADGLVFTAGSSQVVTIGSNFFNDTAARFLFVCGRSTANIAGNGAVVSWEGSPGIGVFPIANKTAIFGMGITQDPFGPVAVSQRVFLGFSATSTSMTSFRDAATTATATGTLTAATQAMQFGRYSAANAELTGDISFVIAGKGATLDLAKYQQLYTLYKNTSGTGLGLP